jgi:hypothetical protein
VAGLNKAYTYRSHQKRILPTLVNRDEYALFHDMGSGKTLTAISAVSGKFNAGKCRHHLVIAPSTLKTVWEDEYRSKWDNNEFELLVHNASSKKKTEEFVNAPLVEGKLKVLVVGVEGLISKFQLAICRQFTLDNPTHITIDESTFIKNYKAQRSKNCFLLGKYAKSRLILTGSPSSEGLEDLYSQLYFLNPGIIGIKSYYVFKTQHCVMGGFEQRKIVGYHHTDELWHKIKPFCDVRKINKSDYPEQVFTEVIVPVTKEQRGVIEQLEMTYGAIFTDTNTNESLSLSVTTVLERLTRFQQVLGGSFPYQDGDGSNSIKPLAKIPKLEALIEQISLLPSTSKVVVWARFMPEINRIIKQLIKEFGSSSVVTINGTVSLADRKTNSDRFQHGDARFMVTNRSGSRGYTWSSASYNIYYSNDYSFETRMQSERRTWGRDNSTHDVVYIDLLSASKYDTVIRKAHRNKSNVASYVLDSVS